MNDKLYKWFCKLSDEIMNIFDYLLESIGVLMEKIKEILDELEYDVFDNLEDMYSEVSANYYQNKFKELRKLLDSSGDHIPRID